METAVFVKRFLFIVASVRGAAFHFSGAAAQEPSSSSEL
jgi:hypothetical protein